MNEKLKELIKLSQERPELEVIFSGCVECDTDYNSQEFCGSISDVNICKVCEIDGFPIPDDELLHYLADYYDYSGDCKDMGGEEYNKFIQKKYNELKELGEIKEKIVVYLDV